MGYYTQYDLKISYLDNANQGLEIAKYLDLHDYEFCDDGVTLTNYFESKWYYWKEDCTRASLKYPKVLIEIEGVGEESDDRWKARVQNGLCEVVHAKIVFPDFNLIKWVDITT
jgi:hypothetical protein